MEKIATDIYTFEELRKKGFTYVDKTDKIWPLVNESIGKQFFMARPRRFGKSLLISTLRKSRDRPRFFQSAEWRWSKLPNENGPKCRMEMIQTADCYCDDGANRIESPP